VSAAVDSTRPRGNSSRVERILFLWLFIGFCTLFTWVQVRTPLVLMKPFDLFGLLVAPVIVLGAILNGKLPRSNGFFLIALFLILNTILALKLGPKNGVREGVQAVELICFAAALSIYHTEFDWHRMARWFLAVALLITAYNGYWHISNGFTVGWKRLDEPKLLFSYAPPVIFALMLMYRRQASAADYAIVAAIALVLVLSGERKAQLIFALHLALLCAVGYLRIWVLAAGGLVVGPLLYIVIMSDNYLRQQFTSTVDFAAPQTFTLVEMADPRSGVTQSNGQRIFAAQFSAELIRANPIWGIGTNGYHPLVQRSYSWLPPHFLVSIHNEFQRVAVENGLFGLGVYVLPWLRSLAQGLVVARRQGMRRGGIYAMFFVSFFVQCFFEGAGNEAFMAFIMMALLPEFFRSTASNSAPVLPAQARRPSMPARARLA